jgi:tetratricopeptide (TPR) repeat protein
LAPEDQEPIPELPDDDAAHFYAATGAQVAATGLETVEDGAGKNRLVVLAVVLLLGGGSVGGMMVAEVGPFEPEPVSRSRTNTKTRTGAASTTGSAPATNAKRTDTSKKGIPSKADPVVGVTAASSPTLAEVAGFRGAIGALEEKKAKLDTAGKLALVELYGKGALEYPENTRWVKSAQELMGGLPAEDKNSAAGKRAGLLIDLASGKEGAVEAATALVATSTDGADQYIKGYTLGAVGDRVGALKAYGAAYAADKEHLNAQRLAGQYAMELGRLQAAKKIFEGLYGKAPGAPGVNTDLAAIESRLGRDDRAEQLLTQVFKLKSGRARSADRSRAFLLRARLRSRLNRPAESIKDLESAVRAWPRNIEALDLLAENHFAKGDYDKALERFQGLVRAGFKSPQLAMKIAECFGKMGRADRAIEEIEEALLAFPAAAGLHATLGDIHVRRRAFPKAKEAYEKAIELDPTHGRAHLKMSEMLVQGSKVDEAIKYLEAAIEKNPRNGLLHLGLAELKRRMAETSGTKALLAEARSGYERAVKSDPSLVDARRNLVTVLLSSGEAELALEELEHLAQRPDFHGEMSYEFGRATQALGRIDEAIEHYQSALKLDPTSSAILLHAGSALFDKKAYGEAKDLLKKSSNINPKEIQAHFFLGRIALIQEQNQEAIQRFKQALELNKRNYENRYWLGRALEASGNEDQRNSARQEYDLVAIQAAKDPALAKSLCDVFLRRADMEMARFSEWQGAINDLNRYLKCNPGNATALLKRGTLRDKMGDLPKAIKDFESAIASDSSLGKAYSRLAYTRLRLPRPNEKKVKRLLEKAIKNDKSLAMPHYTLCAMVKERDSRGARRHCELYLKLSPTGDYASEAKDLLRSL